MRNEKANKREFLSQNEQDLRRFFRNDDIALNRIVGARTTEREEESWVFGVDSVWGWLTE